jgi:hypothetical protein
MFKNYQKTAMQPMRPYVLGENMKGISISEPDSQLTTLLGGMIAVSSKNPDDKWYIAKKFFEENYQELLVDEPELSKSGKAMTFGQAVHYAKLGYKVARSGWNGAGMFAYVVSEGSYPAKSAAVKGVFANDMVPYRAYWALKTAQNDVAPWAPSGSDALAEDWELVY